MRGLRFTLSVLQHPPPYDPEDYVTIEVVAPLGTVGQKGPSIEGGMSVPLSLGVSTRHRSRGLNRFEFERSSLTEDSHLSFTHRPGPCLG